MKRGKSTWTTTVPSFNLCYGGHILCCIFKVLFIHFLIFTSYNRKSVYRIGKSIKSLYTESISEYIWRVYGIFGSRSLCCSYRHKSLVTLFSLLDICMSFAASPYNVNCRYCLSISLDIFQFGTQICLLDSQADTNNHVITRFHQRNRFPGIRRMTKSKMHTQTHTLNRNESKKKTHWNQSQQEKKNRRRFKFPNEN